MTENSKMPEESSKTNRITIALIPQAESDLAYLAEATHLSKTDLANRALQLYAFLQRRMARGAEVFLKEDGETQLVHFL